MPYSPRRGRTVELRAFDPTDDADAIADLARREIARAMLRITQKGRYRDANPRDRFEGILNGIMVGVLGWPIVHALPGNDAEIRAMILRDLPYYFDRALEIAGREPLGEIQ